MKGGHDTLLKSINQNIFSDKGTSFVDTRGIPNQWKFFQDIDTHSSFKSQEIQDSINYHKITNDIIDIKKSYLILGSSEVEVFIFNHPFLIDILKEAPDEIKRIFKNKVSTFLEVITDPEENFSQLFIIIRSHFNAKKARQLMDNLDNQWFIGKLKKTKGLLCITEEPYEL